MSTSIEVFQDLYLRAASASSGAIRAAVLSNVCRPWRHEASRESEFRNSGLSDDDVIALLREPTDDLPGAGLVLWQELNGYRVANIVPTVSGELGIATYNALLQDFVERVARPASQAGDFQIESTATHQTLDDWVDVETARSLRRFSNLANKATGAAHPLDEKRWFEFVVTAHRHSADLDPARLVRWLIESEGWPEDGARGLARDYEVGRALLKAYDQTS